MNKIEQILGYELEQTVSKIILPELCLSRITSKYKAGVKVEPLMDQPSVHPPFPEHFDLIRTFQSLEMLFQSHYTDWECITCFQKYMKLPKTSRTEKVIAQIYRMLRIYYTAFINPKGRITFDSNKVCISCNITETILTCKIGRAGAVLLASAVTYYLNSFSRPESETYVDAMLETYYSDIVDQVDNMNDEDNELQVFCPSIRMNRHYRCVCGNVSYKVSDGYIEFLMDPIYRDKGTYPLDLYIMYNQILHIIPVEALINDKLVLSDLCRWQTRHYEKGIINDN